MTDLNMIALATWNLKRQLSSCLSALYKGVDKGGARGAKAPSDFLANNANNYHGYKKIYDVLYITISHSASAHVQLS